MYVISCTYGTFPDQLFASKIRSQRDAQALLIVAQAKGYTDAMIETQRVYDERQQDRRNQRR